MGFQTYLLVISGALLLAGCDSHQSETYSSNNNIPISKTQRWYTADMVEKGGLLFQANCASCHQADASGTANWKEPGADGKYPPPPLDGTAHTWHHPLPALRKTIRMGGIPLGGSMPNFEGKLSDQDIDNLLAWIQTHWSDDIYNAWSQMNHNMTKSLSARK